VRVLVLAPQPFYQERGTTIAVDRLAVSLSARGDEVDLLTYHEGEDRSYPGVRIVRIPPPPFGTKNVMPGLSWKKLVCDLWMLPALVRLLRRNRYDVIHAVEESAFMALVARRIAGIPFVYDMDSSMVSQIVDRFPAARILERPLRFLESLPVRGAAAVLPMCDSLADSVARYRPSYVRVLRDVSLLEETTDGEAENFRLELGIEGSVSMYIGNLQPYQGIDLLLRSFAIVRQAKPDTHLVVIGGMSNDVAYYRALAESLFVGSAVHFVGPRPLRNLAAYMTQADVLVSPRTQGVNTPMKIYSYLDSGVAALLTDLPTHTQVADSSVAQLAPPEPAAFAAAWLGLLEDRERRRSLAIRARERVRKRHSRESFHRTVSEVYGHLEGLVAR
jgi:glycosyltransferase involved in cell wall biosynthesis